MRGLYDGAARKVIWRASTELPDFWRVGCTPSGASRGGGTLREKVRRQAEEDGLISDGATIPPVASAIPHGFGRSREQHHHGRLHRAGTLIHPYGSGRYRRGRRNGAAAVGLPAETTTGSTVQALPPKFVKSLEPYGVRVETGRSTRLEIDRSADQKVSHRKVQADLHMLEIDVPMGASTTSGSTVSDLVLCGGCAWRAVPGGRRLAQFNITRDQRAPRFVDEVVERLKVSAATSNPGSRFTATSSWMCGGVDHLGDRHALVGGMALRARARRS